MQSRSIRFALAMLVLGFGNVVSAQAYMCVNGSTNSQTYSNGSCYLTNGDGTCSINAVYITTTYTCRGGLWSLNTPIVFAVDTGADMSCYSATRLYTNCANRTALQSSQANVESE